MEDRMGKYGQEQRASVRLYQRIPVDVKLINEERDIGLKKKALASLYNISGGGVCIEAPHLPEGLKDDLMSGRIKLLLEIHLPDEKEAILALARIVWLSKIWKEKAFPKGKYVIGARFTDLTTFSKDRIVDYILKAFSNRSQDKGKEE